VFFSYCPKKERKSNASCLLDFSSCEGEKGEKIKSILIINSNGTENFAAYKAAAAKAAKNVPASNFKGGVLGNIPIADAAQPPI
jgi:hypothetical protein